MSPTYRVEGLVKGTTEVAWIKGRGLYDMALDRDEVHALLDNPPSANPIRITPVVRCATCPAYVAAHEIHECKGPPVQP